MNAPPLDILFAKKLQPICSLKKRYRYYVLHGGRYSTKSWTVAKWLIVLSFSKQCRILCTREIQKTIKDSVHRLLWDMIISMKLESAFEKTENEIRCKKTGSFFSFRGLKTDPQGIKSAEGYDYLWVEEAENVSTDSWDNVIPTIRKENSEIYIVFNDRSEQDEVYKRYVSVARDDVLVIHINYTDLPKSWIPNSIWKDILNDKETRPDHYKRIWLGQPGGGGHFFSGFGYHLREQPFNIPAHECNLYSGLDYGDGEGEGAGATSFGLWHIDKEKRPHRLFTYYKRHQTAGTYAREIIASIRSFPYTSGVMPKKVFADPSMFIKRRMDDTFSKSVADIFKEYGLELTPANNDRVNGWRVTRNYFEKDDTGIPRSFYWNGFNDEYEAYIPTIQTSERNPDDCVKGGEDHIADDTRYLLVAVMGLESSGKKTNIEQYQEIKLIEKLAERKMAYSETGY